MKVRYIDAEGWNAAMIYESTPAPAIPEAAVEAARLALEDVLGYGFDAPDQVRLILEAAAPHLMAEAWDEGIESGVDGSVPECDYARNPYRPTP